MKIQLTIEEVNNILKEKFNAESCDIKEPYDYTRHFELEINPAPNSQNIKLEETQAPKILEKGIPSKVLGDVSGCSDTIHQQNKELMDKDYKKGCGEMIYGAWNDGDRTYDEPCDGVNHICDKCSKEDLHEQEKK